MAQTYLSCCIVSGITRQRAMDNQRGDSRTAGIAAADRNSVVEPHAGNVDRITRIAWDGLPYTYAEFESWYGLSACTYWHVATPAPSLLPPALQTPSVSAGCDSLDSSSGASDVNPVLATLATGDNATLGNSVVLPHAETLCSAAAALKCPVCKQYLCDPQDLCFFSRHNAQGGHEVHLMLRPELSHIPAAFLLAPNITKGATNSWQCSCGHELGHTRPVGPNKASMTSFKSASVMLYGQHHLGKKSKWPTLCTMHPFNNIEIRTRDTFHGP